MPSENHIGLESAAQHLVRNVPTARAEEPAHSVWARLPGAGLECLDVICVIDETAHLRGLIRHADLLAAPGQTRVEDVMDRHPPTVHPDDDQEDVAGIAVRYRLTAVPVIDAEGRLEGVVPAQALIDILRHEHVEDLHRLAGIQRESVHARDAIEAPPARRAHDRIPWLLVGLVGSALATLVVSRFEHVLESRVTISFFVPAIVYLADAIGTQTEAVAVRGLSLSHMPFRRLLLGELWTGTLIGLCLGAVSFLAVLLAFGDPHLAGAVALSLLCAGMVATSIGLFLPWLLASRGADPAFGSGPLATIIQDVLSLLIYFEIVQLVVR
jgi:magnesium transporter